MSESRHDHARESSSTSTFIAETENLINEDETRGNLELADFQQQEAIEERDEDRCVPLCVPVATSPEMLIRYLYIGHFLARWGARMWEFCVGLYFISIWPNSLLLAATYGVVESGSVALFGSAIGKWIDKLAYAKVLWFCAVGQNFSFISGGFMVMLLLAHKGLKSENFAEFVSFVIFVNFCGAVNILSLLAETILIEREWVVVISEGQPPETLTQMNSVIRRIDLICKLFAPVLSGFIISFVSLEASAKALLIWNVITVYLQYSLLMSVYIGIPALKERNQSRAQVVPLGDLELVMSASAVPLEGTIIPMADRTWVKKLMNRVLQSSFITSWKVYLKQDVVLPGLALALLFFTVLSFGTLMTATLTWKGIPAYIIGLARGVSAAIGVAATILYPILQSRISTLRAGLWSVWSQWIFLNLCVASVWVQSKHLSAYMLMAGVATSRLGLWMFDLSVIQLMQDMVLESDRGSVAGVQSSLQSTLDLMASVMGIIISNPRDFWKLTLLSFAAVTVSTILYSLHVYQLRKHLIHAATTFPWPKWFQHELPVDAECIKLTSRGLTIQFNNSEGERELAIQV